MDSRFLAEELRQLEEERFCTSLELKTMAGLVLQGRLERWMPGFNSEGIEMEHARRYEWVSDRVLGKRVLDVACGAGRGSQMMAEAGAASVVGLDIDPEIVRYASHRHATPGVDFRTGDAATFCSEEPFDAIVSFETIEHVPEVERFLASLAGLLAPDGALFVSTPISSLSHDPKPTNRYHVQEWGYPRFASVLAACFRVDETHLQLTKEPRNYARRMLNSLGLARRSFEPCQVRQNTDFEPLGRPGVKYRGFQILVCSKKEGGPAAQAHPPKGQ
ncbi:MAG: methyltransferase domain-containing protein [Fimbriimonadaceae bacterium]|nr:methyltransferase domain-containing protein [Fimbriimonadaceae bacterium]